MVGLLATLISIFTNWHRVEFRRIRNSAAAMVIVPGIFIVSGAFLGAVSWGLKIAVIEVGLLVAIALGLWLAWRRLAIGAELGTLLAGTDPQRPQPFLGDVRAGVHDYLRLVAAILAGEITAGLIALWLPAHTNPAMALLLLPTAMAFVAYYVWRGGEFWWPKVVNGLAVFTLLSSFAAVLVPFLLPATSAEVFGQRTALDAAFAAVIRGDASPFTMFWVFVALFVAIGAGVYLLKKEARRPVRWAGLTLLAALFVSWLIWGAGWDAMASYGGAGRPAAIPRVERRVPVELKPGKTVRLDDDGPRPLVPPGYSVDFEMKTGWVFLSSGGGEPVELGMGKRHPWRSPMVLSGNGTVALLLYRN